MLKLEIIVVGDVPRYTLIHDSHHNVKNYVKEPIKAGMFNLGYLPGSDKSVTTMRVTTMPAIEAAKKIKKYIDAGYAEYADGRLRLTEDGFWISNAIIGDILV